MVSCVMQWLTKVGQETDLKEAIDIKSNILAALHKYKRLNIAATKEPGERFLHDLDIVYCLVLGVRKTVEVPSSPPHSTPPQTTPITASTTTATQSRDTTTICSMDRELERDPTTIQAQLGVMRRKK